MNEIDVIVDVRQVPGELDLIVVRQRLAFSGEPTLVGPPTESRIQLSARKATVRVSIAAEHGVGLVLIAHVKNVGLALLDRIAVGCWWVYPTPRPVNGSGLKGEQAGGELSFNPSAGAEKGPLLPGETREYYLPSDFFFYAGRELRNLPPENFGIRVVAGEDELARLYGEVILPYLDLPATMGRPAMDRRVRGLLDALRGEEKEQTEKALDFLARNPPGAWPGAQPLEPDGMFLLPITDAIHLVARKPEGFKTAEVTDILRREVVEAVAGMDKR